MKTNRTILFNVTEHGVIQAEKEPKELESLLMATYGKLMAKSEAIAYISLVYDTISAGITKLAIPQRGYKYKLDRRY